MAGKAKGEADLHDAAIEQSVAAVAAEVGGGAGDGLSDGDVLAELAELQERLTERTFGSLEEVFAAEELEQSGAWVRWHDVPDAEFLVCHIGAASEKREKLEERFREKHQIPLAQPLKRKVHEGLFRESLFGTVVKGWRGETVAGLPFTEASFRKLIATRRFRVFLTGKASSSESFRVQAGAELAGN